MAFRFHQSRYWIGLARNTHALQIYSKVALTIDEGLYCFELRAVRIRGVVTPQNQPPDALLPTSTGLKLFPGASRRGTTEGFTRRILMRLSDREVQKWLGASMVAQIATLSDKEVPTSILLWFVDLVA